MTKFSRSQVGKSLNIGSQFLFISDVVVIDQINSTAKIQLPCDFPITAHFIDRPTLPASVIFEAMAQVAAMHIFHTKNLSQIPMIGSCKLQVYRETEEIQDGCISLVVKKTLEKQILVSCVAFDEAASGPISQGTLGYSFEPGAV